MRILISNDDGYFSPGIEALASALANLGEVVVFAPERDRSGASNSLVAVCRSGMPDALPDEQGRKLLPSVVHYRAGAADP